MKRKIFLILCTLIACVCLALGLAACGGTGGGTQGGNGGTQGGNGSTQGGNDGNAEEQETHDWSDWEIVKEATCTEEGSRTRTCDECGKAETETIPAKDHTFNDSNVCKDCGFELVPTVGLEYELYEETEYPRGEYYRVKGMGTATDTDLVIPANHAGKAVKQIAAEAFNGKDALTSVYIPKGVAGIGMNAFSYCISLTALHIPASVTTIGKQAFYGCSKIKDITLGTNGITIGESAFENTAYYKNNKNWDNGALYIGAHLIATNDSLPSSYTVKEDTSSIATKAFANRSELKEIVLPYIRGKGTNIFSNSGVSKATATYDNLDLLPADQITDLTITSGTVNGLTDFTNVETLVLNCDWYYNATEVLTGLGKLRQLTMLKARSFSFLFGQKMFDGAVEIIRKDTKTRKEYSVYAPYTLNKVTILSGDIPESMFWGCTQLQEIDLGKDIKGIGDFAFFDCPAAIHYKGDMATWCGNAKSENWSVNDFFMWGNPASYSYVTNFTIDDKPISENLTLPNDTKTIAAYVFAGFNVKNIYIPESVQSIDRNGFPETIEQIVVSIESEKYCVLDGILYDKAKTKLIVAPNSVTGDVTIPDSVSSIGSEAFRGCTSITSVTIGSGVTSIGELAFNGCTSLMSVNINDLAAWCNIKFREENEHYPERSGTANPLYYAHHLYWNGEEVTALTIPDGITNIKSYAFCGGALTSVIIPDSVTSIGSYAFYDCNSLASVTIGDGVTSISIHQSAFTDCTSFTRVDITDIAAWCKIDFGTFNIDINPLEFAHHLYLNGEELTALTIPDGVTSIGNKAFCGCASLTSVTIGNGVTSIGSYAFEYCTSLTSVTIGDSVTSIGESAFEWCTSLTSVTIGDGVTSIGRSAFYYCTSLTSVTIGGSVTTIGKWAFEGCYKLIEVWNHSTLELKRGSANYGCIAYYAEQIYKGDEVGKQTVTDDGYIFYEDGEENYLLGYMGKETQLTLPTTSPSGKQYEIYRYAFYYCRSLTSVTIPDGVTSIGDYAFCDCKSLTSVTIGSGVTSIGEDAFTKLTKIEFQGTVAQWQKIQKGTNWNNSTDNYTITCTDGKIDNNGKVTMFDA